MDGDRRSAGALQCADYTVHSGVHRFPSVAEVWFTRRPVPLRGPSGMGARRTKAADYLIGSYSRLNDVKDVVLDFAAAEGQSVGDHTGWHVHHLVEGSVYADVHFEEVSYDWMYAHVLPCILVSREEHLPYFHGVSRGSESRELYGLVTGKQGGGPPADRAKAAWTAFHKAKRAKDVAALADMRRRVQSRAIMLDDLHHYDAVFRAITANVFRRALQRLDEPAR